MNPAILALIAQGIAALIPLIPGITSAVEAEAEAALTAVGKIVPLINQALGMTQNPGAVTQDQVDALVAAMDAAVDELNVETDGGTT